MSTGGRVAQGSPNNPVYHAPGLQQACLMYANTPSTSASRDSNSVSITTA